MEQDGQALQVLAHNLQSLMESIREERVASNHRDERILAQAVATRQLEEERIRAARVRDEERKAEQKIQKPSGIKIREFNGETTHEFQDWLLHCQDTSRCGKWEGQDTIMMVLAALSGKASRMAASLPRDMQAYESVDKFWAALKEIFISPAHVSVARAKFERRTQLPKENIREFQGNLKRLWCEAYGQEEEPWRFDTDMVVPTGKSRDHAAGETSRKLIDRFIFGLRDAEVHLKIHDSANTTTGKPILTYHDAVSRALEFKSNADRVRHDHQFQRSATGPGPAEFELPTPASKHIKQQPSASEPMDIGQVHTPCMLHPNTGHSNDDCRAQQHQRRKPPSTRQGPSNRTYRCYGCNQTGHLKKDCPKKKPNSANALLSSVPDDPDKDISEDEEWISGNY